MLCHKYLQMLCVILVTGLVCGATTVETATLRADPTTETAALPADPATELNTDGIFLTCDDTQMIVEIPTSLLTGGMESSNVGFENDASDLQCLGVDTVNDENKPIIKLTTNLTACGTVMTESDNTEMYTNGVISRYDDENVISRHYAVDIPLSCSYNRSQRVGSISYRLTDYTINKDLNDEGAYTFSFDIYTSDSYETVVPTYPVNIGLNEELYFAASVLSLGGSLDLSIRSCRATPDTNYNSPTNSEFIQDGCPVDSNAAIQNPDGNRKEVTLKTLRFVGDDTDLVYIHCNLMVCDATNEDSVCNEECPSSSSAIMGRKRRDVSSELKTRRFTRGPLRVVRSAQRQGSVLRLDDSENGASTQQEVTNAFNPWIVAMAAMATVVMAMAAMMVVVQRKVIKISAAPARYKEESTRLADENEEI